MIFIVSIRTFRLFLNFLLLLFIAHDFTKVVIKITFHRVFMLFGFEIIIVVIIEGVEFVYSNVLFLLVVLIIFLVGDLPPSSLLLFLLFLQHFLPHLDHILSFLIALLVNLVDHDIAESGHVIFNCSLILLVYLALLRLYIHIWVSVVLVEISLLKCFPDVHQSQHRAPNSPNY